MALLVDSRRLTGPNRLLSSAGAVIDVECSEDERARIEPLWREYVGSLLSALSWCGGEVVVRAMPTGVSLAFEAPIDALYAATEVNEWSWQAALDVLEGREVSDVEEAVDHLRTVIEEESNPALMALRDGARARGLPFLSDDDEVSVGHGVRSRTWPVSELPDVDDVPWQELGEIPVLLVTGTNGKTTTVRLLASIATAAGRTPGFSSTDGIWVGGELSENGDYSGPGGARTVLRNRGVELAILETARGGLLRRGVAVESATASVVLNVSEDHLGEFGVHDLAALRETKFLVTKVVDDAGVVALNADDPMVLEWHGTVSGRVALFSLDSDHPSIRSWLAEGRPCAFLDGERLVLASGGVVAPVLTVEELPIALGGAARHNISNALAATILAHAAGISLEDIATGLSRFAGSPSELPGRCNRFSFGGLTVLVDFAHNPHGHSALLEMAARLPARRWCVVLGQAGDRDDDSIRELTRLTHAAAPDRIFVKDMGLHLRGREAGEVPRIISDELDRLRSDVYEHHDSELAAVRSALAWGRAGDLLLLPVHESRDEVLDLLAHLESAGWVAGDELP